MILLLCLCYLFYIYIALFIQSNDLLHLLRNEFFWGFGRTTWYQAPPLVTCWRKSWHRFFITRACLPHWLTRNSLPLVSASLSDTHVTLSPPYFNLFENFTVGGCNFHKVHWNKGQSILLWSYYRQSCCNILDRGLCALRGVLQW